MNDLNDDMTEAREAVDAILSLLDLETFLFTAEPRGSRCAVRVDYVTSEGWKSATICTDTATLCASAYNPLLQQRIAAAWQQHLASARAITALRVGRSFVPAAAHH